MSCASSNGEILDLEEEVVRAAKRACGASATSMSVHLPSDPRRYREGVLQASLEWMQRDYGEQRGLHSGPNEASRLERADDVSLEKLLEQELSWG